MDGLRAYEPSPRAAAPFRRLIGVFSLVSLLATMLVVLVLPPAPASAAVSVTITPTTWDVLGLDSNRPGKSTPSVFPVGAKLCAASGSDALTNVTSTITLSGAGSSIALQSGSPTTNSHGNVSASGCVETYFHVEVNRNASSFGTTKSYTIQFFNNGTSLGTSGARSGTLYVEKLVSQNRNAITSITSSACSGTTCTFGAGQTYTITLWAKSAPGGYNVTSAFLAIPSNLLTVTNIKTYLAVPSGYSAAGVYGDGCGFNQTTRLCVNDATYPGLTGLKAGGNPIRVVYTVKASSTVGSSPLTNTGQINSGGLRGIIYDLSGSSFHYNADAGNTKALSVSVVEQADLKVDKTRIGTSSEGAMVKSTTSSFAIKVTNNSTTDLTSGTSTITDQLPTGFTLNSVSIAGGTPADWSCSPTSGAAPNVTCTNTWGSTTNTKFAAGTTHTITFNVTAPTTPGNYANTATVSASGYVDPVSTNNSSTDSPVVVANAITLYDLDVAGTGSTSFSSPGTGTYTLTLRNNGPGSAPVATGSPIRMTSTLPTGVTLASLGTIPTDWTCPTQTVGGSTIVCERSTALPKTAGSTNLATLTVNVNIASGVTDPWVSSTTTLFATSDSGNANDANVSSNTATVRTPVGSADLTVRKTHTGAFPIKTDGSGTGSFSAIVTNNGPSAASGIRIVDTLPSGLTFTSSGSGGGGFTCTASGQTVTCTSASSLASGSSATVSIPVTISSSATPTEVTNNVSVDTAANGSTNGVPNGTYDPDSTNNSDIDIVSLVETLDLVAAHTASASVTQPAAIAYTVTLTNNGPAAATNAYFTQTLPSSVAQPTAATFTASGFTFTTAPTFDESCGGSGTEFTCLIGSVPSGGSVLVSFSSGATSTTTPNPAPSSVTVGSDQEQTNTANDTATASTAVSGGQILADLSVTKSLASGSALRQGQNAVYDIVVTNNGPSAATGITLNDTLPTGLTYVSASGTSWSCTSAAACSLSGSLASGSSTTLSMTVAVASSATGSKVNSVTVSSTTTDSTSSNNTATSTDTVVSTANLAVTKTLTSAALRQGQNATYSIVVTNNGPSAATGITANDSLPSGLTFVSGTGTNWTCTSATACSLSGSLANGASSTLTLTVAVDNAATGSKVNSVTVTGNEYDPSTPNTATSTDTVVSTADLSVTKTLTSTALRQGQNATYDIV
ncbi:MAG TPA: DUF11 domain-containing protein, partial [Acidimicrobiales bacterium]|nr:DUF11 domain-containing protein [Acidimicrobiales bacterium]